MQGAFGRGSFLDRWRAGKFGHVPVAGGVLPCKEPSAGEASSTAGAQGSSGMPPSPEACFHASGRALTNRDERHETRNPQEESRRHDGHWGGTRRGRIAPVRTQCRCGSTRARIATRKASNAPSHAALAPGRAPRGRMASLACHPPSPWACGPGPHRRLGVQSPASDAARRPRGRGYGPGRQCQPQDAPFGRVGRQNALPSKMRSRAPRRAQAARRRSRCPPSRQQFSFWSCRVTVEGSIGFAAGLIGLRRRGVEVREAVPQVRRWRAGS